MYDKVPCPVEITQSIRSEIECYELTKYKNLDKIKLRRDFN